jgi:hypothetical protein
MGTGTGHLLPEAGRDIYLKSSIRNPDSIRQRGCFQNTFFYRFPSLKLLEIKFIPPTIPVL